jgi:broad specificity phosphatase PhoE
MGSVILVRHGQASFGTADYDVLSPVGRAQSTLLGRALSTTAKAPDVIISGSMRRQRDTAEAMKQSAGWRAPITVDDQWDEFDHVSVIQTYADAAGGIPTDPKDRREFQTLFVRSTGRWASANYDEEYKETFEAFTRRVRAALGAASREAGPGRSVVVVSSGGAIAAAAAMLVGVQDRAQQIAPNWQRFNAVIVNTSVTRVVVGSSGARLLTFNEHGHLHSDHVTYR